jgi:hypothetical protein
MPRTSITKEVLDYLKFILEYSVQRDPKGSYVTLTYTAYTTNDVSSVDGKCIVQRLRGAFDVPDKQRKDQPWIKWQEEHDHPVFSIWDGSGSLEAVVSIEKREIYQWLMAKVRDHDGFEWFSPRERCRILCYFKTCPDPEKLSVGPNYFDDGNQVGWSYDLVRSAAPLMMHGLPQQLLSLYTHQCMTSYCTQ